MFLQTLEGSDRKAGASSMLSLTTPVMTLSSAHEEKIVKMTWKCVTGKTDPAPAAVAATATPSADSDSKVVENSRT